VATIVLQILTCRQCGTDWTRPRARGGLPIRCPDCAAQPRPPSASVKAHRLDTSSPGYKLALALTGYRLAIEEATAALRIGRPRDALAALERVEAPVRKVQRFSKNVVIRLPA
jgi:hypothetical protein